jgi:hypothetical protein
MSHQTLTAGVKELDDPNAEEITTKSRIRKAGAGRKPVGEEQPGMLESLEDLVSAHTKGDPMSALLWINKSLRNLEAGLSGLEYTACYRVVGVMLKMRGYGLQADKKTLSVTVPHKDWDTLFEHINGECKKAEAKGVPVLLIDEKKKEKRGNVTNHGRTCQPAKTPLETLDHAVLYPLRESHIYTLFEPHGFMSADTA